MPELEAYDGDDPFFFVCYAHTDSAVVESEMAWLQDAGVNLWFDEGIQVGSTWRAAIAEALDKSDGVLFMCSRHSLESTHCQKEVSFALDRTKSVYVVRLDDTELTADLALYLNDRQLLEKNKYSEDVYRKKLLQALGADASQTTVRPSQSQVNKRRIGWQAYAAVALIAVVAMAGYWFTNPDWLDHDIETENAASKFDYPRVAIMPVEQLTNDATIEYLARSSAEDLRQRMRASVHQPVNVPPSASDLSVFEIGEQFDVDYVWYQSLARNRDVVRISKRLVETREGADVATFQHDLTGSDQFELQDQLALYGEELTGAIDRGETERVAKLDFEDMTAWDLVYAQQGDPEANRRRALEMAPDLYNANSSVARDLMWSVVTQRSANPEADKAEALRLARRGYELAPFDQSALEILARSEIAIGEPARALVILEKFKALKSFTSFSYYETLIVHDRIDEALEHGERNPLIDPLILGHIYLAAGRFDDAARLYFQQANRSPDGGIAWLSLANALGLAGRPEEAMRVINGMKAQNAFAGVASFEVGVRRYWGQAEFGDLLVEGLKALEID